MNKKNRIYAIIFFILAALIISFISIRGDFLQYKELGESYLEVYNTNLKYYYITYTVNFVLLYILIYFTNKGIKKGLKVFFEKENKELPDLPNKSIAFIASSLISVVMSKILLGKIILFSSNTSFGVSDPIFNLDISFYTVIKPLITAVLIYAIGIVISLSIYMALYYIIVFNRNFEEVDGKLIKESLLIKKIIKNIMIFIILIAGLTIINTTNINTDRLLTIKTSSESIGNIEMIGASYTNVKLQRWGYLFFSVILAIAVSKTIKAYKKDNTGKIIKNIMIIPGYLLVLFFVMLIFDVVFVNSNKLDKEKQYLEHNINFTKNAYNIHIEEKNLENEMISTKMVGENASILNNIRIINKDIVLKTLSNDQTGTGYYSYRNANVAKYKISGEDKLVYISPRELANSGRTYNNKTYEYTHGRGQIVVDSSSVSQTGAVNYLQKDITGKDDILGITKQEIYFGLETNDTIATNTKNKTEYSYTDEQGKEYTSKYDGKAGLKIGFFDKIILGIKIGDLKLAFSTEMTNNSKILINRNIVERAKKAMPYLIYEEEPYTVVTEEGKIVWVLDGYTVSNQYPYSQFSTIQYEKSKQKINYIRNSVKVIIDSYDGTMKFYITDKTDPIIMGYRNIYNTLFEDLNSEIPEEISKHFVYPKLLYKVQSELLKIYHNVKYDVLYRTDDLWDFAKINNTVISKSSGIKLEPYYTMIKDGEENKIGLIQIYTPESKQNLIAYIVGETKGSTNKLKLYKYSQDSNIVGPMQLDNQIEQDENIAAEIQSLNTAGTKVTKDMLIVPIENTLLYVESVYQTMLNEEPRIPMLKKVVVASGNKLAIGNNLREALNNLLSKDASNIEVESTDDLEGLIDAIIRANKNLTESSENNNWELMGSDISRLQSLINSLEKMKKEEDKKKANKENVIEDTNNTNIIEENDVVANEI